jgi:hypothetical protein
MRHVDVAVHDQQHQRGEQHPEAGQRQQVVHECGNAQAQRGSRQGHGGSCGGDRASVRV